MSAPRTFDAFLSMAVSDCIGPPAPATCDPAAPLIAFADLLCEMAGDLRAQAAAALDRDEVLGKLLAVEELARAARDEYLDAMGGRR